MKPTVLIATGIMNAGGTESLLMEMLRHSTGNVLYVMLIHYDGVITEGVFDDEIRRLGVPMHYIRSIGSQGVRGYLRDFKAKLDEIGHVDIVHSHLNASGGIISLAAARCGIKHRICHCHADIHYPGSTLHRIKQEISLTLMKVMIDIMATDRWACSDAAWHRLFMPWRKKTVLDNMIDVGRYLYTTDKRNAAKERFGLKGKFIIGSVGRVAPIKNYETIIKALKQMPDAEFVCFGRFKPDNEYCAGLIHLAESVGVSDRVHWMGNSNDIASDIHCIDIFVMPSITEGFGMAAIEAQAAGLPSVVSDGVPAIIDIGLDMVSFVRPYDVNAWITAITDMRKKKTPDNKTIEEAFRRKNFDSREAVKHIEDIYRKMYE